MAIEQASSQFAQLLSAGKFNDRQGQSLDAEMVIQQVLNEFIRVKESQAKILVLGNGGSAAIASHVITDLRNVGGLCAITLHEAAPLTCYTNDFGYEQAFAKQVGAKLSTRRSDLQILDGVSIKAQRWRGGCRQGHRSWRPLVVGVMFRGS